MRISQKSGTRVEDGQVTKWLMRSWKNMNQELVESKVGGRLKMAIERYAQYIKMF
jgi:hypothetical protein